MEYDIDHGEGYKRLGKIHVDEISLHKQAANNIGAKINFFDCVAWVEIKHVDAFKKELRKLCNADA